MIRGDLVTVAMAGEFRKPRPALVIQSDAFANTATVSVLLLTSIRVDAPLMRLDIQPSASNGLLKPSQIMIDKIMTVRRDKIGARFGRVDDDDLLNVSRALALFVGLG